MLFDLGWTELLLIGVVALVFIGPKDLPKALRVAGFWVRKARTLSREFQSSIDQMIREAELDEIRQDIKKAGEIDIESEFRQTIDPDGSLHESLKPPELPNFAEPDSPSPTASEEAVRAAAEAVETDPPQPAAPETAAPETAAPETAAPETAALETAAPETAALETAALETGALETVALEPEAALPAAPGDATHHLVPPKP